MFYWLHRDEGEAGGAPPAADPNTDPNATNAGEGGAGEGEGGKAPELTPDQQIEKLTKERDDWTTKHADIAKKLGEQSGHIKTLKDLSRSMTQTPDKLIENIAKSAGLNVTINRGTSVDLAKTFAEGDAGEQAKAIADSQAAGREDILNQVKAIIDPVAEHQTATKYPDWDDLGDFRDSLQAQHTAGNVPDRELYHLAARGANVESAIKAAREDAVKEYIADLTKKEQGQIAGASPSERPGAKEAQLKIENVLGELAGL